MVVGVWAPDEPLIPRSSRTSLRALAPPTPPPHPCSLLTIGLNRSHVPTLRVTFPCDAATPRSAFGNAAWSNVFGISAQALHDMAAGGLLPKQVFPEDLASYSAASLAALMAQRPHHVDVARFIGAGGRVFRARELSQIEYWPQSGAIRTIMCYYTDISDCQPEGAAGSGYAGSAPNGGGDGAGGGGGGGGSSASGAGAGGAGEGGGAGAGAGGGEGGAGGEAGIGGGGGGGVGADALSSLQGLLLHSGSSRASQRLSKRAPPPATWASRWSQQPHPLAHDDALTESLGASMLRLQKAMLREHMQHSRGRGRRLDRASWAVPATQLLSGAPEKPSSALAPFVGGQAADRDTDLPAAAPPAAASARGGALPHPLGGAALGGAPLFDFSAGLTIRVSRLFPNTFAEAFAVGPLNLAAAGPCDRLSVRVAAAAAGKAARPPSGAKVFKLLPQLDDDSDGSTMALPPPAKPTPLPCAAASLHELARSGAERAARTANGDDCEDGAGACHSRALVVPAAFDTDIFLL